MKFWFIFFNLKNKKYYKIKFFFKKYLIFNTFYNKFIFSKFKKKLFKKKLFKDFFWNLESRVDIFLIRNGFIKNLQQSIFILKNKGVYINGLCVDKNYSKIKSYDIVQILYSYLLFFKLFSIKKKETFKFFFFFRNFFLKKKYPFYIEKNYKTNSCIIFFKPEPFFNIFNNNLLNFNFFFYRYLFYFIKKKTF